MGESDVIKHIVCFGNKHFPILNAWLGEVGQHQTVLLCTCVGEDIDAVSHGLYRRILKVHVVGHLHELSVGTSQVAHIEVVSAAFSRLRQIHYGFFFVDYYVIETQWKCRILIEQFILALRSSELVIIDFMHFVLACEGMTCGCIVGTVIETVASPGCIAELCPFNMVGQVLLCFEIFHVDFLPIAPVSTHDISHIAAIMRETDRL